MAPITQEHHSLVVHKITEGSYDVLYKAEGYHDAGFEIIVVPEGETTFSHDLEPIAEGEIWLQSRETVIPDALYLNDPTEFALYISDTSTMDVEYATRVEFESLDLPEPLSFLFPAEDSDLAWSRKIPADAYVMNYVSVTLPPEAIPADMDEATFDVSLHLLAR